MRMAVMAPQETPTKLGNSYLIAKIWNESSNFRHFDFSVSNNHIYFIPVPLPLLIEEILDGIIFRQFKTML